MDNKQRKIVLWSILALIIITALLVGQACDPEIPLQIENQTDMALTIYVQQHEAENVEPNSSIKIRNIPGTLSYYLIEAKDRKGEVIYTRKSSFSELNAADWKVVIPPWKH